VKVPDARRDAVGRLRVGSLGGDHAAKGQSHYDDAALNGHCCPTLLIAITGLIMYVPVPV
jgi:hypothetical protein